MSTTDNTNNSNVTNNVTDPLNQKELPDDVLAGLLNNYDQAVGAHITVEALGDKSSNPAEVAKVAKLRMALLLDRALTGLSDSCDAKAESVKFNACKFVIEQNMVAATEGAAKSPWEQLLERLSEGDETVEAPMSNPNE